MIRYEAIKTILGCLKKDALIIAANGFISRDLYSFNDRPTNFYMLGSMGLASSISLGLAESLPHKKVIVLDGDGNILMNMGSLVTIGNKSPKNLIHIVLDNGVYESTGGQTSGSDNVALEKIAKACGYRLQMKALTASELSKCILKALSQHGPAFILVKIKMGGFKIESRVSFSPVNIKKRFMKAIKS